MRRKHLVVTAAVAATALLAPTPAIAGDPTGPTVDTIAEGLSSPLQVKAFPGGTLVSQSGPEGGGPGRVTGYLDSGESQDFVRDPGAVSGFDFDGRSIAYTSLVGDGSAPPVSRLKIVTFNPARAMAGSSNRGLPAPEGENLANLGRYENRVNPDGDQVYGIAGVRNCDGVPRRARPYSGIKESNPYAVEAANDGGWFVADAAANAILHVDDDGAVETVMVLPVQRVRITRALAEEHNLPACTVGKTMRYEPVPTDVEEGAAGRIYVTLLPGEPGSDRGKLLRYNPSTERTVTLARRLVGATNLALANKRIFVNELFAGRISVIDTETGRKSTYLNRQQPAASDYLRGALYATTDIFGPAKLIKVTEFN